MLLRVALLTLGAFGVLDTLCIACISNMNLGVWLPGIMGLPLLLIGLFLPKLSAFFTSAAGNFLKWLFIAGYALAFVLFTATCVLIHAAANKKAPQGAAAVIVLGAGLRGERPTLVLKRRMDTAIAYLNENPASVAILSGGKGEGERISEAEAMARYFAQKGIPTSRFIKEDQSESTQENFLYSLAIIRDRFGADASVAFVTTDFHVYRAQRVAQKLGMHVNGIAAPDVWYISLNNHLRECVAVWEYAFKGKI